MAHACKIAQQRVSDASHENMLNQLVIDAKAAGQAALESIKCPQTAKEALPVLSATYKRFLEIEVAGTAIGNWHMSFLN